MTLTSKSLIGGRTLCMPGAYYMSPLIYCRRELRADIFVKVKPFCIPRWLRAQHVFSFPTYHRFDPNVFKEVFGVNYISQSCGCLFLRCGGALSVLSRQKREITGRWYIFFTVFLIIFKTGSLVHLAKNFICIRGCVQLLILVPCPPELALYVPPMSQNKCWRLKLDFIHRSHSQAISFTSF